jgi:hypothetical protein
MLQDVLPSRLGLHLTLALPSHPTTSTINLSAVSSSLIKERIKYFVPTSALKYLEQMGKREDIKDAHMVRTVTTIFVNFVVSNKISCTLNAKEALEQCMWYQTLFTHATEILEREEHGGMVRQFLVDDKGCNLIVVFGTPEYTHQDDPLRAVR